MLIGFCAMARGGPTLAARTYPERLWPTIEVTHVPPHRGHTLSRVHPGL